MGYLRTYAIAFGAIALTILAHLFAPPTVALIFTCGVVASLVAKDAQTHRKLQSYRKLFMGSPAPTFVYEGSSKKQLRGMNAAAQRIEGKIHDETVSTTISLHGAPHEIVVAIDRTEHKKLEAQLRHAQKMDAVGQLAGGVAHDFNNMLSVILGFSYALLEDTPETSEAFIPLTEIKRAAERSADLTKQLLAFSRQKPERTTVVDLNDILRGTDGLIRKLVGATITTTMRLTPSTCCIEVDETQLGQVIMNLSVNARDAMPNGGNLTIETRVVDNEIVLAVSDTGVGMDTATQGRIFEPFFTTKGTGKGTGLGLSIVFAIVRQHGGRVTVESEEGRGTTFVVHFPAHHKRPAAALVQTHVPSSVRGDETILVVDDEEQVLQVTARVLQRNGYRVLTARHPGEALVLSEKFHEPIDLLITDVVMPQMNGRELAERLVATRAHMKVIYTSGFTNDVDTSAGSAFLQKPVTPQDLGRKVREVLGPTQTRAA